MDRATKEQRTQLQALSQRAYELELMAALKKLRTSFDRLESGEISAWELSEKIHEFHDGKARDLYQFYTIGREHGYHVAHAIQNGILTIDDVPEHCRERVQFFLDNSMDS